MKSMAWQVPYILFCLAGLLAIFHIQRHRSIGGCRWWLYNVLALALIWEGFDAWKYGTPGWPASRWLLVPAMTLLLAWRAIGARRPGRAAD